MFENRHQAEVEQLGDDQHGNGDAGGRLHVLVGVKPRRQHLDGDHADQADAPAHQGKGGLLHVKFRIGAVMENHRHQGFGEGQQRHRTRHRQQHHQAQAPVEHGGIVGRVIGGFGAGQLRHQHHTQGHTQHGGGEFHQAVGITDPGDAARRKMRGDLGVDKN